MRQLLGSLMPKHYSQVLCVESDSVRMLPESFTSEGFFVSRGTLNLGFLLGHKDLASCWGWHLLPSDTQKLACKTSLAFPSSVKENRGLFLGRIQNLFQIFVMPYEITLFIDIGSDLAQCLVFNKAATHI